MAIIALLENIRSAYNVGSFFRTADGAGVQKLILAGITPTPPHNGIAKTALGAENAVAWEHTWRTLEMLKALKEEGYAIVVVEKTAQAQDFQTFDYPSQTCLVFGHEVDGVSDQVLALADATLQIPMRGIKESLNVSSAFAIVAYAATVQHA